MSWQSYVDDHLVGTGKLSAAALIGHDGNVWAQKGLAYKPEEGKKLIAQFADPASAQAGGLTINGTKYMCIKADANSLYGKKGAGGAIVVKTKQAVVIALYNDTMQTGPATATTEKLADYLKETGY
eukprot:TRINITY_DN29_c0_g1_i2.p1 TRINITY_DN29_c0_g1~~TRINITY_DN29_c0_g1_i2.p1  ORF type:complete len:126 (-),score=44.83 TRINITY_DN29_c0_g1_i2:76-453(-)